MWSNLTVTLQAGENREIKGLQEQPTKHMECRRSQEFQGEMQMGSQLPQAAGLQWMWY
jgi:hypothetical protein